MQATGKEGEKHEKEPAFKRMKELGSCLFIAMEVGRRLVFPLALVVAMLVLSVVSAHMQASGGLVSDPPWGPSCSSRMCLFALVCTLCSSWLTTLIAKKFYSS